MTAVTVTAHCPCGQSETITEHDRHAALHALDTLQWRNLDTDPTCPSCTETADTALALAYDDWEGNRRTDVEGTARRLTARRRAGVA